MILYKFLNGDESPYVPGFRWQLRRWQPEIKGHLVPCKNGYHLLRVEHLSRWIAADLYVAELDEDMAWLDAGDKIVGRRARIVEHLTAWNERTARLAAADFAEAVLPIWEERFPDDDRPRLAIQAARDYANGLIKYEDAVAAAAVAAAGAAASRAAPGWAAAAAAVHRAQGQIILDYAYGRRG